MKTYTKDDILNIIIKLSANERQSLASYIQNNKEDSADRIKTSMVYNAALNELLHEL